MKKIELEVLCELMRHSKQSDRDIAKKVGVSQPTITRTRRKLEKEGYIREYTMIPDFRKLGFELIALTFAKFRRTLTVDELKEIRKAAKEIETQQPHAAIMVANGEGCGFDRVVISFHENYSSFTEFNRRTKQLPFLDLIETNRFLIPLTDDHYLPLTFSLLSNYLKQKAGIPLSPKEQEYEDRVR